eukprot:2533394-Amphidinium_carterae.1
MKLLHKTKLQRIGRQSNLTQTEHNYRKNLKQIPLKLQVLLGDHTGVNVFEGTYAASSLLNLRESRAL